MRKTSTLAVLIWACGTTSSFADQILSQTAQLQRSNAVYVSTKSEVKFDAEVYQNSINSISLRSEKSFLNSLSKVLKNNLNESQLQNAMAPYLATAAEGRELTTLKSILSSIPLNANQLIEATKKLDPKPSDDELNSLKSAIIFKAFKSNNLSLGVLPGGKSESKAWLAVLPLLALGGGGGGDDGSAANTYSDTTEGVYGTEYTNQAGLTQLNIATSLNNYGYTGDGIKVAVVDTGIDSTHSEFSGRTITGTDFGGSSAGYGVDSGVVGHGTHVASIIGANRDGVGMRGVAYDATLYDYKVADDSGSLAGLATDSSTASVFNQMVTDGIQVANNSWGDSSSITNFTEASLRSSAPLTIAAMKAAIDNGTIIVFSAGNSYNPEVSVSGGLPYFISELADGWLTVVSVDPSNVETNYTNRCGVAADFCVTAPGGGDTQSTDGIYGAQTGGGYVRYSGTSMAAPHVTGLAALLMQKFPSLTNTQIVTRIKATSSLADLTGYYGETLAVNGEAAMQAIFGHGLVNQTAASSQIGSLNIATSNNFFKGGNVNIDQTKLKLPSYLPASITSAIKDDNFMAFDSFDGAGFSIGGDEVYAEEKNSINPYVLGYFTNSLPDSFNKRVSAQIASLGTMNDFEVSYGSANQSLSLANADFWGSKAGLISVPSFFEATSTQQFGFSKDLSESVSIRSYTQFDMMNNDLGNGFGFGLTWEPLFGTSISAGKSSVKSNINMSATSTDATQSALVDLVDVNVRQRLSANSEFFANVSQYGVDKVRSTPTSFGMTDASYLSQTYGVEITTKGGNKFSLGAFTDGVIQGGNIDVVTAVGRTSDGNVYYENRSYDAGGRSQNLKMGIFMAGSMPINGKDIHGGSIGFNYQSHPNDPTTFGEIGAALSFAF